MKADNKERLSPCRVIKSLLVMGWGGGSTGRGEVEAGEKKKKSLTVKAAP